MGLHGQALAQQKRGDYIEKEKRECQVYSYFRHSGNAGGGICLDTQV